MKKILAALVILSLAGCQKVMSEDAIEAAVRECTAQGGTPRFVSPIGNGMHRHVSEVRCYGVQP